MIEIKSLNKNYGKKEVLKDISVNFPDNNVNFLMGKNGSGKTTLLKCISELERYEGNIYADNEKIINKKNELLILWDDCSFYDELTGIDNLDVFSEKKCTKKEIFSLVENVIDRGLLRKKVKTYSYGQKKKLGLALAIILDPKYIMMDEISNGLDYDTLILLKKIIKDWKKSKTILLTGHQFSFYDDFVDNVYVINNNGKLIEYMNVQDLGKNLKDIYNETMH